MQRHSSIIPLSRDHHTGLLCCWKLRQGIRKSIQTERLAAYLLYFWNTHLIKHFREEEALLFNNIDDPLCSQAVGQHEELKILASKIKSTAITEEIAQFADLLEHHIRFEERVVFPHLENSFTQEKLAGICKQLEDLHDRPVPDEFPDEFWK